MRSIISAEWKRVLPLQIWILFSMVILIFTVYDDKKEKSTYTYVDADGNLIDGRDVLKDARQKKEMIPVESILLGEKKDFLTEESLNYLKVQNLVEANYSKQIGELTAKEAKNFYERRISHIRRNLVESSTVSYNKKEIDLLVEKASQVNAIMIGYAEGWSSINRGMEKFVPLLLLGISMMFIPLFGEDAKVKMNEFIFAAKWGRRQLDFARIFIAFGAGTLLYLYGMAEYVFIKLLDFGSEGGNFFIQGEERMFFSVYPISYIQQFSWNFVIGYFALFVAISFTLIVCILIKKTMACSAVLCFFWIFLLVGDQMNLYITNHYFFNFMPYRMTKFHHYYLENDLYRVGGESINSMVFTTGVAAIIVFSMLGMIALTLWERQNRKFVIGG